MTLSPQLFAILGGVLALAGGIMGSALGMGRAASAGTATISEEPGQFRNVLILASLPMTQTFYGLIVLIIVVSTVVPNLGDNATSGLAVFGIGIFAFLAEWLSAWFQGVVCASAISVLPKSKGLVFTPGILLAAYLELLGILGMVLSIMFFVLLDLM
jgi:V/A-type H+-transporting ATPase subunit K